MPSATIVRGSINASFLCGPTLTPASIAANTTAEQSFTVAGLQVGDFVNVTKPTTQAGIGIANARVISVNTLAIAFANVTTAGALTPTAGEVYVVMVDRPENLPLPTNAA